LPPTLLSAQGKDPLQPPGKQDRPVTDVVPLTAGDAEQVTAALRAMFPSPKTGGPFIEYFPPRGPPPIPGSARPEPGGKGVLRMLDEFETRGGGNTRTIHLEKGSAATLALAIQRMLHSQRGNPVKIVAPEKTDGSPKPEPADKKGKGLFDPKKTGDKKSS